jgi:hypothetical protein
MVWMPRNVGQRHVSIAPRAVQRLSTGTDCLVRHCPPSDRRVGNLIGSIADVYFVGAFAALNSGR